MEFLIVVAVAAVVVFILISIYNRLVALNQKADQAFADIDVQLRQRRDLVPNLVETVKGYAAHEKETLENVVSARNSAASAHGAAEASAAEGMLSQALGKLFALAEAYPDLKANQNFMALQSELSDIENKLAAARRFFNNAISEYNAAIQQIPANLIAGPAGFKTRDFFEIPEARRAEMEEAPEVSFGAS